MIESEQLSRTSSSNYLYPQLARQDGFGNFFLSKGCFNYVQNWVDWDSLPICEWRSKQLNFQEELYEVVNSRERGRVNGVGILAWMDYDGIENTLDQTQYTFAGGLKSYANTLAAIQENALPEVLHAAIIKDYRCWMFHVPNMWPMYPTNERSGNVLVLDTSHHPQSSTLPRSNSGLTSLPIELLYEILIHLAGLSGYFQISALSKYLRSILCEPTFYSRVLRGMLTHPGRCLYWVLPLTSIPKEAERAKDAMNSWIDAEDRQTKVNWNQSSFILKLIDPEFPLAAFVKACFSSDSMMNRKRIWGQVKQLEEVWRDYRLNGWRIDRFGVEI
ncbi:hypothetical protein CPB83DRAFT_773595 [Crepidotus variabilis]|uniref:F-box domain-containing protein n=1 Tax=Crepidotus variabilis TaxID=179855 RepID=A0A9P6JLF2_9AGAR|nr:hypothetical protein CPB83DRAFT_773595 [Crepidotus variabilis]